MNNDDRAKFEALTDDDIAALRSMQNEYDSLLQRWGEACAGSQEVADLHATFKARERSLGKLAEQGLFKRVLSALASAQAASAEPALFIERGDLDRLTAVGAEHQATFVSNYHSVNFDTPLYTTPAPAVAPAAVTDAELDRAVSTLERAGWRSDDSVNAFAAVEALLAPRTPEPQTEPQPDSRGQAREGWISVRDRIPQFQDGEDGLRVVVLTADHDFGGAQVHDIPASDFYAYDPDDDEPGTEVTKVATHWMPRHELIAASPTPDEQRAREATAIAKETP